MDIHPFHKLLISLALGLLVGLQRQWADSPLGGIRTFSFISLLGAVCAILAEKTGNWLIAAGLVSVAALGIAGKWLRKNDRTAAEHTSLGNELAMLLVFLSGVLVQIGPIWFAATLAALVAILLHWKPELHGIVARFDAGEVKAIMQFALISLVILPIVPDQTLDPLQVVNLHDIWIMVVIIVAISLSGYIVYKFFGEKAGIFLGGILGGVISSTATTISHAKMNEASRDIRWECLLIILLAWATVYVRLSIEILIISTSLAAILWPFGILFVVSLLPVVILWRKASGLKGMPVQGNPAELKTALTFAVLYAVILFAVAIAKKHTAIFGLVAVSAFSGLTDMDAITLSTARLFKEGKLTPDEAMKIIIIAIMSNTVFKGAMVRIWGGSQLFRVIFIPWLAVLIVGLGIAIAV